MKANRYILRSCFVRTFVLKKLKPNENIDGMSFEEAKAVLAALHEEIAERYENLVEEDEEENKSLNNIGLSAEILQLTKE